MRRHVVVAYDIADDRRRAKVARVMEDHGDRVQYSVFFCQLNARELSDLRGNLRGIIHHDEDQVLFVDLGPANQPLGPEILAVGLPYSPNVRAVVV